MASFTPYLHFNGNCEEAFTFYKSVLGGQYNSLMRYKDIPGDTSGSSAIVNVALSLAPGVDLMGSDGPPGQWEGIIGENFSISYNVDSQEEADRVFNGLSEGGTVIMPMADMFWGAYFGMLKDRFSINWMISFPKPRQ